jgi:Ca-activated chloride channel homolog
MHGQIETNKIVIIGDGDDTASRISARYAADLAKKNGIELYGIGIGTRGLVPLGRDEQGNPNIIEDTFTDTDFKTMARLTGGRYYHANNAEEVYSILQKIFSRP